MPIEKIKLKDFVVQRPALAAQLLVSLVLMIAANLFLDGAMVWCQAEYQIHADWLNNSITGAVLGQVGLVGLWFGLGDSRWYGRLLVAVALILSISLAFTWSAALLSDLQRRQDSDPSMIIAFILLPTMLTTALFAFQLRRFGGWRITWEANPSGSAGRQFQLSDVLLWTVLISGVLGAMRFLHSIDEHIHEQFLEFGSYTARMTMLVTIVVLVMLAPTIRPRAVLLAILGILGVGAAFSAFDIYEAIAVTNRFGNLVHAVGQHLKEHEILSVATAVTASINCMLLRSVGSRLVRGRKHCHRAF